MKFLKPVSGLSLAALLTRSQCRLTHLEFKHLQKKCFFLHEVLQAAPTVTNLIFQDPLCRFLRYIPLTILPNLQKLTLTGVDENEKTVEPDLLLVIMESRFHVTGVNPPHKMPRALREVVLDRALFYYSSARIARLLRLCKDGLMFHHVHTKNGVIEYAFPCTSSLSQSNPHPTLGIFSRSSAEFKTSIADGWPLSMFIYGSGPLGIQQGMDSRLQALL
jgi:hypothetical protein